MQREENELIKKRKMAERNVNLRGLLRREVMDHQVCLDQEDKASVFQRNVGYSQRQ